MAGTTFRDGKIGKEHIVRADGMTDRERAMGFDMSNHGDMGSSPVDSGAAKGNFSMPELDFSNMGADIG